MNPQARAENLSAAGQNADHSDTVLRLDPPQAAVAGPQFMAGVRQGRGDVVQEAASGETAAEQRLSRLARPLRGTSGNLRG